MQTSVGMGEPIGNGYTVHAIIAGLMPPKTTERGRQAYQTELKQRLARTPHIYTVTVGSAGVIHAQLMPCAHMQRVTALRAVLAVLQEMGLHDPAQGIDSHVMDL